MEKLTIDKENLDLIIKQRNLSKTMKASLGEMHIRMLEVTSEIKMIDNQLEELFNNILKNLKIQKEDIQTINLETGEIVLKK